jgi:hypothetical protein
VINEDIEVAGGNEEEEAAAEVEEGRAHWGCGKGKPTPE